MKRQIILIIALLLVAIGLSQLASLEEPAADRERQEKPLPLPLAAPVAVINDDSTISESTEITNQKAPIETPSNPVRTAPPSREIGANAETESVRTLDGMALEAWKHGDVPGALELFEEAVKADPDDALVRSDYGRLLTMMTVHDKAREQFERAAELEPDDPKVWLDLKTLYEREIKLERAYEAHERAEELAGGRKIVKDESGFWMLEGDNMVP